MNGAASTGSNGVTTVCSSDLTPLSSAVMSVVDFTETLPLSITFVVEQRELEIIEERLNASFEISPMIEFLPS